MKKIIRGIFILNILLALVLFIPLNTSALTKSSLTPINESTIVEDDKVTLTNVIFNNHSQTSSLCYGISGTLNNKYTIAQQVQIEVNYYDENYNLKTTATDKKVIAANSSINYTLMSNLNNEVTAAYISSFKYYEIIISSTDSLTTSNNITPSKNGLYSGLDYVIDAYDVYIKVNNDNTYEITEKITAFFNVSKHGIYRKIPKTNTVERLDGTTSTNNARITNITIDNEYSKSTSNGNVVLQIGDATRTITGSKTYTISYTYNIGNDKNNNYDEFYFNIIGTEWDTVIGNVTFKIEMPKSFDTTKLGFSSGVKGSTDNTNVEYIVEGNTITGEYKDILKAGEALTIRCGLEEGYFEKQKIQLDNIQIIIIIVLILSVLISLVLWKSYGKDDQYVETVEFYPPNNINSLEAGFLYNGKASSLDVTSLLIYLANKGYIKITETEIPGLFSKQKSFTITKLKEYDGNNINELTFLDGLFKCKRKYLNSSQQTDPNVQEVTELDLYHRFYKTSDSIILNINSKENRSKIFEKKADSKKKLIILMIIIAFALVTYPAYYAYGQTALVVITLILLFPGFGFPIMISHVFGKPGTIYVNGKPTKSKATNVIFGLIFGLFFGGFPWLTMVFPILSENPIYLGIHIFGLVCIAIMTICYTYMEKRTKYGNEMLGKLSGFKTYLETAEKAQLEALVMQNPTYFYDILPYAYVLGVSDKWISKFETIGIEQPSWYSGRDDFSIHTFSKFMSETMSSASSSMSSGSSSSGSSGGGSSGGGSGGGGGGSW